MKILVINCGSSSIKYKLYQFPSKTLLAKGTVERIGERGSKFKDHAQGVRALFFRLLKEQAVGSLEDISAIGHRVVHGGETFSRPHLIGKNVISKIKDCAKLAPLHNPKNYAGIAGCNKVLPRTPQVAVFDTAFYRTIPAYAYLYAIPLDYYKKYRIQRYGFHGTSHQYIAGEASKMLKKSPSKLKIITCHLGNGCSITAIKRGKAVDTSMGFTPLEGLMMGTRSGDIDPAVAFYIMDKERLSSREMEGILNRKSGLLGISGISNDIRAIKKEARKGHRRARLAWEIFIYRVKKYIGAYYFILGGADAIVFTGGIGENNPDLVGKLKKDIYKVISRKTEVLIIPTDEELMIANLTYKVVKEKDRL